MPANHTFTKFKYQQFQEEDEKPQNEITDKDLYLDIVGFISADQILINCD